jgi:hypothetical protein
MFGPHPDRCRWCSGIDHAVFHYGPCPRVKRLIFHENGTIKEVEFFEQLMPYPYGYKEGDKQ